MLSRAQPGDVRTVGQTANGAGLRSAQRAGTIERMAQAGITLNADGSLSVTAHFDVGDLPTALQPKTDAQLQADAEAAAAAAQAAESAAETVVVDTGAAAPPDADPAATGAPAPSGDASDPPSPPVA